MPATSKMNESSPGVEQKLPTSQTELESAAPTGRERNVRTNSAQQLSTRVTSSAYTVGKVPAASELNETSPKVEQNVPTSLAEFESASPAGRDRKVRMNSVDHLSPSPFNAAAEVAPVLAAHPARHELNVNPSAQHTFVAEGIERAIEIATAGVRRMDGSTLSLVLTPDANTQVSLHVKLKQGQFEVHAVLERGDFTALGANWSQLQNKLAEDGVRLAPLVSGTENAKWFSGQPSFSERRAQQEAPSKDYEIPTLAKMAKLETSPRTVGTASGREWWA